MNKLFKRIFQIFYRQPDFTVATESGRIYMYRWWIIPQNKYLNIYLHKFIGDDEDRALHDHPWESLSFLFRGSYIEHLPGNEKIIYKAPCFIRRKAEHQHRIELHKISLEPYAFKNIPQVAWTIFCTGRKRREWGFWCPQGFVHWKIFTKADKPGEVGRGCRE